MEEANTLFDRLPPSILTYQLAIYYYCLHIYAIAATSSESYASRLKEPYGGPPLKLVQFVTKHARSGDGCWREETDRLVPHLSRYQERLHDYVQAGVLQQLDSSKENANRMFGFFVGGGGVERPKVGVDLQQFLVEGSCCCLLSLSHSVTR